MSAYEEKPAFTEEYKGFKIIALWPTDHGDALVTITREGKLLREFTYPAYKVYNLQAHFTDIVRGKTSQFRRGIRHCRFRCLGRVRDAKGGASMSASPRVSHRIWGCNRHA